jgi:predicted esterase
MLLLQAILSYQSRIGSLDSSNAAVQDNLPRLFDNVILLYREYNSSHAWNMESRLDVLKGDLNFYLGHLENGRDPENFLAGRLMRKACWSGGLAAYTVLVPKTYDRSRANPAMTTYQNHVDLEVGINSGYIILSNLGHNIALVRDGLLDLAGDLHVDPFRIYVSGWSQGGHIALQTTWQYPHWMAGTGPLSIDLRLPNQDFYFYNVRQTKNVPVRIIQGELDSYITGTYGVYTEMLDAGCPVEFVTLEFAHSSAVYERQDLFSLLTDFFDEHVLNPYPRTVCHVLEACSKNYSRAFWVDGKLRKNYPFSGGVNPVYEVTADKSSNTITIDSSDTVFSAFDFYLNDSLVDMSKNVKVVRKGRIVFEGAPSEKLSVILYDKFKEPPTPTTKAVEETAVHLSSGIERLLWQNLDSIRCAVFGSCDQGIPNAVSPGNGMNLREPGILHAYPNPFSTSVGISLVRSASSVVRSGNAEIRIFDIRGNLISIIPRTTNYEPRTKYTWDASNRPAGIYLVRVKLGNRTMTKKIMLER